MRGGGGPSGLGRGCDWGCRVPGCDGQHRTTGLSGEGLTPGRMACEDRKEDPLSFRGGEGWGRSHENRRQEARAFSPGGPAVDL